MTSLWENINKRDEMHAQAITQAQVLNFGVD